ncbi:MAG: hypothetical protein K2Q10_13460 [Rhodospirillales bacterium]|nr:hypothetical protein [Rhodospirillales bacterium]
MTTRIGVDVIMPALDDILDEAVRSWLSGISIPKEYKTRKAAKKPIPESAMERILHMSTGAGMHTMIVVDGARHTIYATFYGPRIWVDGDWNKDKPTAEGNIVMAAVSRVSHEIRDFQVKEKIKIKKRRGII